jgi:hypothetical protein
MLRMIQERESDGFVGCSWETIGVVGLVYRHPRVVFSVTGRAAPIVLERNMTRKKTNNSPPPRLKGEEGESPWRSVRRL